ncbi:MAG: hypothetical protein ABIH59_01090 [archaeon]
MDAWIKGGLIGFFVVLIGLWVVLFVIGHDEGGWKCTLVGGVKYCPLIQFLSSPLHWAFVLFFSWAGFFAGYADVKIARKIIKRRGNDKTIPLKITFTITLSLVIVFAIIGILAFENWIAIMVYAIVFAIFLLFLNWLIKKYKYKS